MKAVQLVGWKQPPAIRDVPEPEPGPGEVLVRIGGAGLCHSDLNMLENIEPGQLPFDPPFTLGHENAGWVEALGPGVVGLDVGQPVVVYGPWGCGRCYRCQEGRENFCDNQGQLGYLGGGFGRDGGMASRMVVPSARHLVALSAIEPADAAPLADAGLTPYHAIKRSLPLLLPGSQVVVIGAGGGLGHLAVQILAAVCPSRVIAVDQREEGVRLACDLGAHEGVVAGPDATEEVRELTGGRGAEVVLDFAGTDATMAMAAALSRSLGHVTIVGAGGGSLPFGFFVTPYEVAISTTYWGSLPELAEVIALADGGHIRSRVQRYSLDDALSAFDALHTGAVQGRAVLVPSA
jgi:alcohol dehydrogenase, propanol-preferring